MDKIAIINTKINDITISSMRNVIFNNDKNQFEVITNIDSDILLIINNLMKDHKLEFNNQIYTTCVDRIYYVPCTNGLLQIILNVKEMK